MKLFAFARTLPALCGLIVAACETEAVPLSAASMFAVSAKKEDQGRPVVLNIAHRGASGHAPEHTIVAYDLALDLDADYIEQDLQLTSDGVLVVLHDSDLDRTARGPAENCMGEVSEKTFAQIKTCDVGVWFNEAFPALARPEYVGQRIPTLEEVFRRYGHRTNYHIETKTPEDARGMEEKLLQLMDRFDLTKPAEDGFQVLIQSFSPASLRAIHEQNDRLPLIQLYSGGESSESIRATLAAVSDYAVGIGPSFQSIDAVLIAEAHGRCLYLHPYTVNDVADMRALIELGVDGMFTNFPDRLDTELAKRAVRVKHAAKIAADARRDCLDQG